MASQAPAVNSGWAHAVPTWMTVSTAKSRAPNQKRAAKIESLGSIIPTGLSCASCRQKGWMCKSLLGKDKMRCARCTEGNVICSLREPVAKQAIDQHFAALDAAQDGEDQELIDEQEEEGEEGQEEEEVKMDAAEDEDEDDDLDNLTDDEEGMQEDERAYLAEENRRREILVNYFFQKDFNREAREARDRPIPPFQRE